MPAVKPYSLKNTFTHPLARMIPFFKWQKQVYRLAEKNPPVGGMADHAPNWQVISYALAGQDTAQIRVNLQRDFWLMALVASSSAAGGFRAQLYDSLKKVRFADRGFGNNLIGGSTPTQPFFLREPYQFDLPDSQVLVILQNLDPGVNNVQLSLYGQVLRFNQ